MMYTQYSDALVRRLREDINNYTNDAAGGACKTFDEYQNLCGVIKGLALAERHITDLVRQLESDPDE